MVLFDSSDSSQLQPSTTDMAITRLAEELESYLFNDFESESSEDELEEREPEPQEFQGKYIPYVVA